MRQETRWPRQCGANRRRNASGTLFKKTSLSTLSQFSIASQRIRSQIMRQRTISLSLYHIILYLEHYGLQKTLYIHILYIYTIYYMSIYIY